MLSKARVQIEADMVVQGMEEVDIDIVKSYTKDLKSLLEESDITERKAFLRSFIKRIEINRDRVIVTNLFSYKKNLFNAIDNTRYLQYNAMYSYSIMLCIPIV